MPADRVPRIAITVGDVAGVGPELAIQCARMPEVIDRCLPVLYGPEAAIDRIGAVIGHSPPELICNTGDLDAATIVPGHFDATTGQASFDAVDRAIADAADGQVDAIVTGPIQKEAWKAAGIDFPGHTELLATRLGIDDFCMMLTSERNLLCLVDDPHSSRRCPEVAYHRIDIAGHPFGSRCTFSSSSSTRTSDRLRTESPRR